MRIFIASSLESLEKAKEISAVIEELGHTPILWNSPGLFIAGEYTLDTLEKIADTVSGAVIVFSEDDKIWYRKDEIKTVRDNVLIEWGIFAGKLHRKNVAICKIGNPYIATDLRGINSIDFNKKYRASIELKTWLINIEQDESKDFNGCLKFGNFNQLFAEVCNYKFFNQLQIYAISTNKTARMLEGYDGIHINSVELLLRKYEVNDPYYSENMEKSIETTIELWREMKQNGIIDQLQIKRLNYHIDSGFYIFDNSFVIIGNLHFLYPEVKVHFDRDAILITDSTVVGKKIINWYIEKFENIEKNF